MAIVLAVAAVAASAGSRRSRTGWQRSTRNAATARSWPSPRWAATRAGCRSPPFSCHRRELVGIVVSRCGAGRRLVHRAAHLRVRAPRRTPCSRRCSSTSRIRAAPVAVDPRRARCARALSHGIIGANGKPDPELGYVQCSRSSSPSRWRGLMLAGFLAALTCRPFGTQLNLRRFISNQRPVPPLVNRDASDRHYVAISR